MKIVTYRNIRTFPFVYNLVSRTYIVSNVNIDIPMIKQESSSQSNYDFKVFKKHRFKGQLITLLLAMVYIIFIHMEIAFQFLLS